MAEPDKHSTEAAYDDHMAPLVARLIEVAKRAGVALFVTAGMLDESGGEIGCTTRIDGSARLAGYNNRIGLMAGIARGHNGFDTAAGLMITKHHLTPEQEAEAAAVRDWQARLRRLWRATRVHLGPGDQSFDAPLSLAKTDGVWRLSSRGARRWTAAEPFQADDPGGVARCWESRLGLSEWLPAAP